MISPTSPKRSLFTKSRGLDSRKADKLFYALTLGFAGLILALVLWLAFALTQAAWPAIQKFGLGFVTTSAWRTADAPVNPDTYGAWPYIWGTLLSSFIALLLAVPLGLGTAIFLAELAPKWMRTPLSFMVELLAAVPSVVYGLWGLLVLVPMISPLQQRLSDWAQDKPIFETIFTYEGVGQNLMVGGLVLAIMVLPFITAVSREVIKAVPPTQREAAFGLGSTHWEAVRGPIMRAARSGVIGAIILGLARAVGETMAVTMVIGGSDQPSSSLLAPANTLASKIALQFPEASGEQFPALLYLALVLFVITIIINAFARLLIWNMARSVQGSTRI